MARLRIPLGRALLMATVLLLSGAQSSQASVDYKGKQLVIVIGYGVGGTYYQYAQLFSRHLSKHLPDRPSIIVQSIPGAGGVRMLNDAANRMRSDGTMLFMPPDTMVVTQLLEQSGILYDARKFHYIGTADQQNTIWVVRKGVAESIQDLKSKEVFIGNSGKGSTSLTIPSVVKGLLDLKVRLISGFEGSRDTIHAIERKEIDGAVFAWQVWKQAVPRWFVKEREFAIPILQVGVKPDPAAPSVPMLRALVADDDLPIVDLFATIGVIGRGLAFPPGVPPDYVGVLREGFTTMLKDPEFLAEAGKMQLRVLPETGDDVARAIAETINNVSAMAIDKARSLIQAR